MFLFENLREIVLGEMGCFLQFTSVKIDVCMSQGHGTEKNIEAAWVNLCWYHVYELCLCRY